MEKINNHKKNMAFRLCIYIEVISGTILGSLLCGTGYIDILKNIAVSITGIMIFVYYYGLKEGGIADALSSKKTFLSSFAVSNILIAFTSITDIGTIWMVAVAAVAAMDGMGHAVSCHLLLMLQYLVLSEDAAINTKTVVFYATTGILLALVVSEIKKRRWFLYAAIIFISLTLVLAIVLNGGNLEEIWHKREFMACCIAGDIALLGVAWLIYYVKGKKAESHSVYIQDETDENKLAVFANADHELMQRIKKYSEALYIHSLRIGNLSYKIAECAGYNKNLAKAGGFYHEAGRIYENEDYTDACNQIATEYGFMIQLSDIIKQHGTVPLKPVSPEAAVVMLSDNIISTDEYFERTGKREQITDESLIKAIFNSRLSEGSFDNSGIDKEQIGQLMDFYINNAFKEEMKEEHYI